MEQIKKFTEGFFRNLKCEIILEKDFLIVKQVPKSFEDLFGKSSPYRISFVSGVEGCEFVGKGSLMMTTILKYLEGAGKATLLRIDFDVDAEVEIKKRLNLNNCSVESLTKGYRNSFFSRFSFVTNFNYLNESERCLSEIYVHNGEIVEGDLSGYKVVDGENLILDSEKVKRDYEIAKVRSVDLSKSKQKEITEVLKERVEVEVAGIEKYYDKALKEVGGDLNAKLKKIKSIELELRSCEEDDRENLRNRLDRLRGSLVKAGDDEVVKRVEKEREMTIRDMIHKYSLNVDRKLVNTTVIYYPVYNFKIYLDSGKSKKLVEVGYDPLTRDFSGLNCEGCSGKLDKINLCEGGHICCGDCLGKCSECGGKFCIKCLKRSCNVCGRKLCRSCIKMCLGCGGVVCATHLRKDCVSGEERCVNCLRACLRCHGMSEEKFFGEAMDGSKVCQKCLGIEKSRGAVRKVFEN